MVINIFFLVKAQRRIPDESVSEAVLLVGALGALSKCGNCRSVGVIAFGSSEFNCCHSPPHPLHFGGGPSGDMGRRILGETGSRIKGMAGGLGPSGGGG